MPMTLAEMMTRFSPAERAAIERDAAAVVVENRTLRDLRKSLNVTQGELAAALETSQANVAKIEGRGDLLVSTVVRVVTALGGTMKMVVELPGRPTTMLTIGKD